jgi:hypothetical protein
MAKPKVGVLLAGAYALGLALVGVVAVIALSTGAFPRTRSALRHIPRNAQRVADMGRVAVRAGSLGVKHLPAVFEGQAAPSRRSGVRLCALERTGGCGSSPLRLESVVPTLAPLIRVVVIDDEG